MTQEQWHSFNAVFCRLWDDIPQEPDRKNLDAVAKMFAASGFSICLRVACMLCYSRAKKDRSFNVAEYCSRMPENMWPVPVASPA